VCSNQGLIIGKNEIPIEPSMLTHLEQFGFSAEYATAALNNNKHNQVTTIYYLLHKRYEKEGKLPSCFKVENTPHKSREDLSTKKNSPSHSPVKKVRKNKNDSEDKWDIINL